MSREVVSRTLKTTTTNRPRAAEPAIASLRLHAICVVMSLLSAFIFTLTEHDDHENSLWCALEIAMQTLVVVLATFHFRRRIAVVHESPVILPVLLMVASLSLICEPFQRVLLGNGHAFEILIMHSSCNLMLALAVCGFRMSFQRLAALIAVFMTIFCCTISNAPRLIPLIALFSIAAIVWLVAAWWETVDRRVLEAEKTGLPLKWLAVGATLPVLILAAADGFGANSVTTALRGFVPSSGGTGDYSLHSRGGVNDGDALVAGDRNIKSFAPIEDAPFLDSEKPSLYDVFNDTFDQPTRKNVGQERAIPLPADLLKHVHHVMAEAKQAGREFSLSRDEQKADGKRIHDLETHAIFYLAGRTPLHLRMEVYELFDGINWMPGPRKPSSHTPTMGQTADRDWLSIPQPGNSLDIFSGTTTHSIKVAHLDGSTIPVPAHPVGVSIDKVDRADMFEIDGNGLISLDRESIPPMTPVSVVSHCVDWKTLSSNPQISILHSILRRRRPNSPKTINTSLPHGQDMNEIRQLAELWTSGLPPGWRQIESITTNLRDNYVVDRSIHASPEKDAPVHEFLFETRHGPEYLFASSAVVMLRSLGYPARVVSGFYARPDKYDARKKHTVVDASDAHFWCEVFVGGGTWLTVEPSPGYEVLGPPSGLLERLAELPRAAWRLMVQYRASLLAVALLATSVFIWRHPLQDALLTLRWKLTRRKSPRQKAVSLAILIDHRLRLSGMERGSGTTLNRWANQQILAPVRSQLTRVAAMADQAVFGHADAVAQLNTAELDQLAAHLSYQRLRSLAPGDSRPAT